MRSISAPCLANDPWYRVTFKQTGDIELEYVIFSDNAADKSLASIVQYQNLPLPNDQPPVVLSNIGDYPVPLLDLCGVSCPILLGS